MIILANGAFIRRQTVRLERLSITYRMLLESLQAVTTNITLLITIVGQMHARSRTLDSRLKGLV